MNSIATTLQRPENIYFTLVDVDLNKVGFTDILMRWSALYKLGTSLNYTYVHQPIICQNSSDVYQFLGFNDAFELKLDDFLEFKNAIARKAYQHRYFQDDYSDRSSLKDKIKKIINYSIDKLFFNNYIFQDITINESLLKRENIAELKDLQTYLIDSITPPKHGQKLLLRLRLGGARKQVYTLVNSQLADFPDRLDLRKPYFAARQKKPCSTKFTEDKIKLLVHIRQGDTAFIETPWHTYIPVYGNKSFTELQSPRDGGYADLIDVDEYYYFVKEFTNRLNSIDFSTVVSSDGYGKAFTSLFNNLDKFDLDRKQIEQLQALEPLYAQKFDIFKTFPNTSFLLGENDANLYDLINATLEADIIILGFRNTLGMLLKIIAHYSDRENPPTIIQLYKYRQPFDSQKLLGIDRKKATLISVQIDNYNWDEILAEVKPKILAKATR